MAEARELFPIDRLALRVTLPDQPVLPAVGASFTVYADEACTQLADITDTDGTAIPNSAISIGSDSRLPLFYGPPAAEELWLRGADGAVLRTEASATSRLDKLAARMDGAQLTVVDFGAVGDAVADDTAAIRAAIAAGGIVHFPAGTFLISGELVLPAGTIVRGAGMGGYGSGKPGNRLTQLVCTPGMAAHFFRAPAHTEQPGGFSVIEDLHIDGANQAAGFDGFHADDSDDEEGQFALTRVHIRNIARHGVYVGANRRAFQGNRVISMHSRGGDGFRIMSSDCALDHCQAGYNQNGIFASTVLTRISHGDLFKNATALNIYGPQAGASATVVATGMDRNQRAVWISSMAAHQVVQFIGCLFHSNSYAPTVGFDAGPAGAATDGQFPHVEIAGGSSSAGQVSFTACDFGVIDGDCTTHVSYAVKFDDTAAAPLVLETLSSKDTTSWKTGFTNGTVIATVRSDDSRLTPPAIPTSFAAYPVTGALAAGQSGLDVSGGHTRVYSNGAVDLDLTSQTGAVHIWANGVESVRARGNGSVSLSTPPSDGGAGGNGRSMFWVDETNKKLMVTVQTSAGTVLHGSVTLA